MRYPFLVPKRLLDMGMRQKNSARAGGPQTLVEALLFTLVGALLF